MRDFIMSITMKLVTITPVNNRQYSYSFFENIPKSLLKVIIEKLSLIPEQPSDELESKENNSYVYGDELVLLEVSNNSLSISINASMTDIYQTFLAILNEYNLLFEQIS